MIKKEITMSDGKKYIVGFKEIKSSILNIVECHILKRVLLVDTSIFKTDHNKGLFPNYRGMAIWTIMDYEKECNQKEELLNANW